VAYVIPDVIKGFDYRAMAGELAPQAAALRRCSSPASRRAASARLGIARRRPSTALAGIRPTVRGDDHAVVGRHDVAVQTHSAHP
jgi:hypothetical protein